MGNINELTGKLFIKMVSVLDHVSADTKGVDGGGCCSVRETHRGPRPWESQEFRGKQII